MTDDNVTPRSQAGVAAVILAGGRSTRMGEAKQLLPLGDSTVLGQTIATVQSSAVDEIILVLGAAASAIQEKLDLKGIRVAENSAYTEGMSTSLRVGLSAISPEVQGALIVLADQPFLQPSTLDLLIDHYRQGAAQIVVPTWQGTRGNPVLLDRCVFADVMALQGDVGCRAIFGKCQDSLLMVEVEDEGILLDIDHREDYERMVRRARESSRLRTGE